MRSCGQITLQRQKKNDRDCIFHCPSCDVVEDMALKLRLSSVVPLHRATVFSCEAIQQSCLMLIKLGDFTNATITNENISYFHFDATKCTALPYHRQVYECRLLSIALAAPHFWRMQSHPMQRRESDADHTQVFRIQKATYHSHKPL